MTADARWRTYGKFVRLRNGQNGRVGVFRREIIRVLGHRRRLRIVTRLCSARCVRLYTQLYNCSRCHCSTTPALSILSLYYLRFSALLSNMFWRQPCRIRGWLIFDTLTKYYSLIFYYSIIEEQNTPNHYLSYRQSRYLCAYLGANVKMQCRSLCMNNVKRTLQSSSTTYDVTIWTTTNSIHIFNGSDTN